MGTRPRFRGAPKKEAAPRRLPVGKGGGAKERLFFGRSRKSKKSKNAVCIKAAASSEKSRGRFTVRFPFREGKGV